MPYVHEVHTSYTNAIIRHVREEVRPSGLIVSHSVAVSEAIFTPQPSQEVEIAVTPLSIDDLSPSTLTEEIRDVDFEEAVQQIREYLSSMGKIATLKFGIFEAPAGGVLSEDDFEELKSFGIILSRALDSRNAVDSSTDSANIGLYL